MTNDNWIQEYKDKFNDATFCWNGDNKLGADFAKKKNKEMQKFISRLLTKKDQEHKAELESIKEVFWEIYNKNSDYYSESTEKGELDNSNEAAYTTSVLNQIVKGLRDKGIEIEKYEIQKDKE